MKSLENNPRKVINEEESSYLLDKKLGEERNLARLKGEERACLEVSSQRLVRQFKQGSMAH